MSNMFTARGQEAKASAEKGKVDFKKVYLRMKSGDSVKVRIMTEYDYVEYSAHASFMHKVYTQPCVAVLGKECPLCVASKSGEEGFDVLFARKRYLFVFADMTTGELRALDVSKNQAKQLIAGIEEYKDDLDTLAFNLKKTGEGTNTTYTLNPIIKMKGNDQEQFDACEGLKVADEYLNTILTPRTAELQVKTLKEAGFPVEEYFPEISIESTSNSPEDDIINNM
ncbi:hypothetical protein [uncultured Clostridium sp.]|jgi:hypothetical protein|uniref:hypothetical protein n=1 Tax=uncultured Clostridium sp. TaxID=59620 RepID=UPI00260FAA47|nr:hypothetical protein [uncultured Clostridium sp.]MCI9110194.1 hypothetical protein [Bacilli bacterium]